MTSVFDTHPLVCTEEGVEPQDHYPQAENEVKMLYELDSRRTIHCYSYQPIVEWTYASYN